MSTLADTKRADRAAAFERRAKAHRAAPGAARQAAGHLLDIIAGLRGVEVISGYVPIRDEIDPVPAMLALFGLGYRLCVPVIEAKRQPLRFREWRPGVNLVTGPFDVRIPESGDWLVPQALIVPLLAFDRAGHRLGYGGGFYDRTIAALRAEKPVHTLGFAYAGQEVGRVPVEETDMPLDAVVTEAGSIVPGAGG